MITLITTSTLGPAVAFAWANPAFLADATLLSGSAVSGQFFIYSQVKEFGALVFAATMNVRQVVSILVSYAMYHHAITILQVMGLILVFAALFYKSASGLLKARDAEAAAEKTLLIPKDEKNNVESSAKV